jgi:transcriptional regulator GlxA family with amidase domain
METSYTCQNYVSSANGPVSTWVDTASDIAAAQRGASSVSQSPALGQSVQRRRQGVVARASEFLLTHATEGVRIADVSRAAGVSERTLRNAFHREHGLSPKQFDLRERLRGARRALCQLAPPRTVTTIATEFGFFELGRFSKFYRRAFGESPSQTLRSSAWRRDQEDMVPR